VFAVLLLGCSSYIPSQKLPETNAPDQSTAQTAPSDVELKKQDIEKNWTLTRGAKEFGFELGFAPTQPTFFSGHKEYDTDGRKFMLGSLRFGRVIGTKKGITYQYLFEIIPVSFAIDNEVLKRDGKDGRTDTYGFGIQPAGFRFIFRAHKRLKPYVQTGAGFIFTNKPIPVPESLTYNFIGDFGGGVMYSFTRKRTVSFGYRYFHISNMNIGKINPGYNANIFYLGYSLFSK